MEYTLEEAVRESTRAHPGIDRPFTGITTSKVDPIKLANEIERAAAETDGLALVAHEDLTIDRAVRNVVARGVPVICLTTDLPSSGRHAFVGSDPTAAGSTAACLLGQVIGNRDGKVLLVYSAPYRVQEERELGFRRVLRHEFPKPTIGERVNSNDDAGFVYRNVMRYIADHAAPAGILMWRPAISASATPSRTSILTAGSSSSAMSSMPIHATCSKPAS